MNHDYQDIISRIPEPPKWWDEHAVPRYCEFSPRELSDIYSNEAVLAVIACQGCKREFRVAFSRSAISQMEAMTRFMALGDTDGVAAQKAFDLTLASEIRDQSLHYGDPPNAGCCAAGPTMNSEPRRVLEYWKKVDFEWVRDPALEIDVEADWVE